MLDTGKKSDNDVLMTSVLVDQSSPFKSQVSKYMRQLDETIVERPNQKVVQVNDKSKMMNILREKDFLRALASKGDLRTGKSVFETSSQADHSEMMECVLTP